MADPADRTVRTARPLPLRLRVILFTAAGLQALLAVVLIGAQVTSDTRLLAYGFFLLFSLLMTGSVAGILICLAKTLPVRRKDDAAPGDGEHGA